MGNDQRHLEAVERHCEALKLRMSGMPYEDIATRLGYQGRASAWRAVMAALKHTLKEPADEVRTLELARLDKLLLGIWDAAASGDLDAQDRAMRIMGRRAKLLGLDAPTQSKVDLSGTSIDAAIERELAKLAAGSQAALPGDTQE